jgi:putative transposase ISC1217
MRADIDKRTNGFKRRCESLRKSTQVLVELIAQAKAADIAADYLLFVSFPVTIIRLLEEKVQVICMLKAMKTTYGYEGSKMTLNALYKHLSKRAGRAKILASCEVTLVESTNGSKVMAKIVFVRNRSSRNWLALLSTDVNLTDEEIVKLYKRRWDIELFFKMTKSYLNLAKEFQGRSYDSLVAHTTVVFTRYIMLSIGQRMTTDPRTMGSLFYAGCDELRQVSFAEALTMLQRLLQQLVQEIPAALAVRVQQLFRFIHRRISGLIEANAANSGMESLISP